MGPRPNLKVARGVEGPGGKRPDTSVVVSELPYTPTGLAVYPPTSKDLLFLKAGTA